MSEQRGEDCLRCNRLAKHIKELESFGTRESRRLSGLVQGHQTRIKELEEALRENVAAVNRLAASCPVRVPVEVWDVLGETYRRAQRALTGEDES